MSKVIPKNVLEDIRNANDIVDVIGSYITLKRAGSSFKALCPFHKEKTPSFNVHQQRQMYHCFGCSAGGDVFKFVMQYENVDFSTAARLLAQRGGIHLEWTDEDAGDALNKDLLYKLHAEVAQSFHRNLLESAGAARARAYLKERALDGQPAEDFLIGYAPDDRTAMQRWGKKKDYSEQLLDSAGLIVKTDRGDHYDRFRGRLMFPIRDELGRVVAFSGRLLEKSEKLAKYVNSPETALFRKGRLLYALDRARRPIVDSRVAILCEGQIDVIRCHIAGFDTAVAAQGTALTDDHARLLKRYADSVIIVLDSDKAGQDASLRSAEVLLGAGLSVSIASLPKGDDPDSLIRKQGAEAFRKVLDEARSVLSFQIGLLRSREDLTKEAALMRAVRAVMETISRAPTAVQRDQLIQQAARELGVSADAIRQDLAQLLRKRTRAATEPAEPPAAPAAHPPEEVALAELVVHHEDVLAELRPYLPLEHLTDAACRKIVERAMARPAGGDWNLAAELMGEEDECQRLAAQVVMNPKRLHGGDVTPVQATRDLILVVWRKALERRRAQARREVEKAEGKERDRLETECKQLTLDIKAVQQGWDAALPILESHSDT